MSQDFHQYAREKLSQAIQEQAALAQEKSIRASPMYLVAEAAQLDFIRSMRELEAMPCKPLTTEELDIIRDGILNIASCDECSQPAKDGKKCDNCGDVLCSEYCHYDENIAFCFGCYGDRQSEDEEVERDEYVIEAIIEREECELLDDIEGDKQAIDYFSEEHIDEFGEKGKKRLEDMRKENKRS